MSFKVSLRKPHVHTWYVITLSHYIPWGYLIELLLPSTILFRDPINHTSDEWVALHIRHSIFRWNALNNCIIVAAAVWYYWSLTIYYISNYYYYYHACILGCTQMMQCDYTYDAMTFCSPMQRSLFERTCQDNFVVDNKYLSTGQELQTMFKMLCCLHHRWYHKRCSQFDEKTYERIDKIFWHMKCHVSCW